MAKFIVADSPTLRRPTFWWLPVITEFYKFGFFKSPVLVFIAAKLSCTFMHTTYSACMHTTNSTCVYISPINIYTKLFQIQFGLIYILLPEIESQQAASKSKPKET